ncbi:MAG: hypothetical protein WA659_05525 [Candidatus Aquirickettsiella sp.]
MKLPLQVCNELFSGKSVDKISHLGSGRMGSVYKITLENGENVCIKVLTKNHSTKLQDSNGWRLAYGDRSFNFKSFEDTQFFYFTMPYFEGQEFQYASQYSLKSRFQIIQNLIKATADIHSKGLLHRDLKCNNIIINKEEVYIIDFGRSINVFDYSTGKASAYIQDLQLPGQGTIPSNIKRIFQPFTASEYFGKHCYNGSTIGFRSDHSSIAQLFRFLIPEFSYLADKVLHTEGLDRNTAFSEFSERIADILMDNQFSAKFNEPDKVRSKIHILYKKINFFICEISKRLIKFFQTSDTISKNTTRYNNPENITTGFFKRNKQNSMDTNLTNSLPKRSYSL